LSEFTKRHVTVALSGDGADELFGGYYRYRIYEQFRKMDWIPLTLRRVLTEVAAFVLPKSGEERTFTGKLSRLLRAWKGDGLDSYLALTSRLQPHVRGMICTDAFVGAKTASATEAFDLGGATPTVDEIMALDMRTYLPDDVLVKVDRASMAHSLEVRSPFLDRDVVELALSMPYEFKQKKSARKRILRDAFGDIVPSVVFDRPKMGFGVPMAAWLRGEWRNRARELLLDGWVSSIGLFDRDGLERLLDEHQTKRFDHSYVLYSLIVMGIWGESTGMG